ncbi:MAG: hypothetical protein P4L86_10450 [Mycobacterium sp.]|nr:hypothetical protein [Mycobacterium sp.]
MYRAVRRTDVFGDADELAIGVRLGGGHELTVVVLIDHNIFSGITDASVVPEPIDQALGRAAEPESDIYDVEMTLADARVWIEDALAKPTYARETNGWPVYRVLVQWLVARLPEGGEHRTQTMDWESVEQLCDRFFAIASAAPFAAAGYRELLLELFETGTEDPLRWSAARVDWAIGRAHYYDDSIPLEVVLDAPDLLRVFIPFAHAQSGVRDELTSRTLDVIDELRLSYKREVLSQARRWGLDDAG